MKSMQTFATRLALSHSNEACVICDWLERVGSELQKRNANATGKSKKAVSLNAMTWLPTICDVLDCQFNRFTFLMTCYDLGLRV